MPRYFTKGGILDPVKDYDTWINGLKKNVKTSDDTFTPPEIYEVILEYINEKIIPIDSIEIQRPFYPGGDYQKEAETYNEKSVVIDNPPFSLCSEIIEFYIKNNIKFFIFTNGLTTFNYLSRGVHLLCPYAPLEYENNARVNTCFIHNLLPEGVTISGELRERFIEKQNKAINKNKKRNKYQYPNEVLSVAQSVELAGAIKGEITITNYKGVCGLNYKGKQKKVFCKVMILSKSEQAKIDKIRKEHDLLKSRDKNETQKNSILKKISIASALVTIISMVIVLFNWLPIITIVPTIILILVISTIIISENKVSKIKDEKDEKDNEFDDEIIKFELSEKQRRYRDALEN